MIESLKFQTNKKSSAIFKVFGVNKISVILGCDVAVHMVPDV
jgi:hypothetical protein